MMEYFTEHVYPILEKLVQPLILAIVSIKMANVRNLRIDLAVMNKNIQILQKEVHSLVLEQLNETQNLRIKIESLKDEINEQKLFCKIKLASEDIVKKRKAE